MDHASPYIYLSHISDRVSPPALHCRTTITTKVQHFQDVPAPGEIFTKIFEIEIHVKIFDPLLS